MDHVFSRSLRLGLDELYSVAQGATATIAADSDEAIRRAYGFVDRALAGNEAVYGLTRHLGDGRDREVAEAERAENQRRTVVSHSGTFGERLSRAEVRAIMAARLRGFAHGYSGVSPEAVERYRVFLNEGITPIVFRHGTVGASDLAQLADIAHALMGMGEVEFQGADMPAQQALDRLGLEPLVLVGKDGLGLISSNSYTIGIGAIALSEFVQLYSLMELSVGFYLEAMRCNLSWLDEACSRARPFLGQSVAATRLRELLHGSELFDPATPHSLQDPLSIRSISHLLGAALEAFASAASSVERELNASGDNPMVDPDGGRIISTANFNPFEIALGFEQLRIALAHLAIGGDRRIQHLAERLWASEGRRNLDSTLPFGFSAVSARIKALARPVTLDVPALVRGHEDLLSGAPLAVDATRETMSLMRSLVFGEILLAADILLAQGIPVSGEIRARLEEVRLAFERSGAPAFTSKVLEQFDGIFEDEENPISSLLDAVRLR